MASWGLDGYVAQLCLLGYVMLDFTGREHPSAPLAPISRGLVANGTSLADLRFKPKPLYTYQVKPQKTIVLHSHALTRFNDFQKGLDPVQVQGFVQ